jgi:DNA/RNA-binding domain of Phe-tRNA-synthetase-like protein
MMRVSEDARGIVAPLMLEIVDVTAAPRSAELDEAIARTEAAVHESSGWRELALARTRGMYRGFGVDPTRTRPSSEALLRRVRKGERLPLVNQLVDIVNWCSVESQVPFGLYDRQALAPPIVLRLGAPDEGYAGIRKERVNVAGRVVLADEMGPFGNPTSDSARAMVTPATSGVLVVLFVPAPTPPAEAAAVLEVTRGRFLQFTAGRVLDDQNPK